MKTACLYSVIRYLPYTENEEFANVGILLCCPKSNYLSFKLSSKKNKRVNSFFNDSSIYASAREYFNDELNFIKNDAIRKLDSDTMMANFFVTYITRKESIFQFSDVRTIISESPEETLDSLYNKFIKLSEVTIQSREAILERELKNRLNSYSELKNLFKKQVINGKTSKFLMPLVAKNNDQIDCAIKPLAFNQIETNKMVEHCDTWVARIRRAADEGLININNVLLPLDYSFDDSHDKLKTIKVIKKTLMDYNIYSVDYNDENSILEFVKSSIK